jgi:hypothetical protein
MIETVLYSSPPHKRPLSPTFISARFKMHIDNKLISDFSLMRDPPLIRPSLQKGWPYERPSCYKAFTTEGVAL